MTGNLHSTPRATPSSVVLGLIAMAAILMALVGPNSIVPAGAQDDPYNLDLYIADPSVCGGEAAVANVTGTPGESVTISFAGQSQTVTISAAGTASASFSTNGVTPGNYSFDAVSGSETASAPMFVLDPASQECSPTQPPSGPYLTVSVSQTCVAAPVVVTVTGANSGDGISVIFANTMTEATAGADGSAQVTFPTAGLPTGSYDVNATTTSGKGDSAQVQIVDGRDCGTVEVSGGSVTPAASPDAPDTGALAMTGSTVGPLVGGGAALLLVGGLLVWRSRRSASA